MKTNRAASAALVGLIFIGFAAVPASATNTPAGHGIVAGQDAVPASDPVPLPVPTIRVAQDVPGPVQLASKSGRYIISSNALFDRQTQKTLKRFAGTVESISDDGRYVTYSVAGATGRRLPVHSELQRTVKVYDRITKRTRTATTTSSGRALKPSWRTPCTPANGLCDEGPSISQAPQLEGGAISGNGHYVVFCANYVKPDRVDLYIKNWRSKKLTRVNGACSYWDYWDDGRDHIYEPSISEDGNTILLPGRLTDSDSGSHYSPSRMLVNRSRLVEIGGRTPTMTHDGRTISLLGQLRPTQPVEEPDPVAWYDRTTGSTTPSDPGCTQLSTTNASRHGRYFIAYQFAGGPCQQGGPLTTPTLTITDRSVGATYDLSAALAGNGYQLHPEIPGGQTRPDGRPATPQPVLTGDGKVVFVPTTQGWVSLTWAQ